jgi:hypothetical protein
MLNMTLDQYEFSTVDFGRPIFIKLYQEDKATLFGSTGYSGVIQGFKRRSDGSFYYWNDVTRGIAVSGFGAQVVSNIDITFAKQVASVTVNNGGSGYTTPPIITFVPTGEDVTATATSTIIGGVINEVEVTNPGAGYLTTPAITITGGGGAGGNLQAVMTESSDEGTFQFTKSNLANIPGYLWIKAVLFKGGTGLGDATEVISSKFVRVFVDFGSPS